MLASKPLALVSGPIHDRSAVTNGNHASSSSEAPAVSSAAGSGNGSLAQATIALSDREPEHDGSEPTLHLDGVRRPGGKPTDGSVRDLVSANGTAPVRGTASDTAADTAADGSAGAAVTGAAVTGAAVTGAEGDLRQLCEDLKSEVRRLSDRIDQMASAGSGADQAAVLRAVDARFAWLTSQLSDRLVILGNEVVALKRLLQIEN
jgi:hypothetical protein